MELVRSRTILPNAQSGIASLGDCKRHPGSGSRALGDAISSGGIIWLESPALMYCCAILPRRRQTGSVRSPSFHVPHDVDELYLKPMCGAYVTDFMTHQN